MLETLSVYALVAACASYSAWNLAPATVKRRLKVAFHAALVRGGFATASSLSSLPLSSSGCGTGCSGCGSGGTSTRASVEKPVVWFPRDKR